MYDKILNIIYQVVDEVNEIESLDMEKSKDTVLFGQSGSLDSLGLVNFIVSTEQKLQEEFDTPIVLADEKAISQRNSPFRNIETLADYILKLYKEENNG